VIDRFDTDAKDFEFRIPEMRWTQPVRNDEIRMWR